MVKLKMVAGRTYMCPGLFGPERIVTRGEVVEVPEDKASVLLDDSYTDASNNQHHYFKVVDGAEDEAPAKATAGKRTRAATA